MLLGRGFYAFLMLPTPPPDPYTPAEVPDRIEPPPNKSFHPIKVSVCPPLFRGRRGVESEPLNFETPLQLNFVYEFSMTGRKEKKIQQSLGGGGEKGVG